MTRRCLGKVSTEQNKDLHGFYLFTQEIERIKENGVNEIGFHALHFSAIFSNLHKWRWIWS